MPGFIRGIFFAAFAMLVVGCGGGGGSSSTSTPPPATGGGAPIETDTLTLSQGVVNFSATEFEAVPDPVTVTASISGSNTAGIVFGTLPGVDSLPFWLDIQLGEFVGNSAEADFLIRTTDIPEGNYSFTVRAVTFDVNDSVLDTADLNINFVVAAGIPLSVSPESVDVEMHFASEPIEQVMSVTAGNYTWSAFSTEANLSVESGTGSQDVILQIFPPMPELVEEDGQFQGFVDVFQNNASDTAVFNINYTVFPTLDVFRDEAFLNAVSGGAESAAVGVNLEGEGLTWQASSDVSWLNFSATSGTVLSDEIALDDPAAEDFTITVDPTDLAAGPNNAIITVTAEAEQSIQIPVTVEVGAQILMPSKRGIALAQTATTSALQAQVAIGVNIDRNASWAASSDAAWLSVTPSGTVADIMTVTADPALLLAETFSEAVITLTSPDAEITQSTAIRVGFWNSALTDSDTRVAVAERGAKGVIVSDPVRPLAYLNAVESEISVVNVYSGAVENTIIPSGEAEGIAVSDDGAFLYLLGRQGGESFIDVVDLETQSISATWPYPETPPQVVGDGVLTFGRISNNPYLFTLDGLVVDAETGELVTIFGENISSTAQVINNVLCTGLSCVDIVTAGFDGARITAANLRQADIDLGGDFNLTQNGDVLYTVGFRSINALDTSDMSLLATVSTAPEDFVEGVVLGTDDTLYVTFRNDGFFPTDPSEDFIDESRFLIHYDLDLSEIETVTYPDDGGGVVPIVNFTTLSGDNRRVIYLLDDGFPEVATFSLD